MLRKIGVGLFPFLLFAAQPRIEEFSPKLEAWVTGPLITPSGAIVQGGYINVEPYVYVTANTGVYDNHWNVESIPTLWNLMWQIPIQVGINDWVDFQALPTFNWNYVDSHTGWTLGDLVVQFDFQLYRADLVDNSWVPSIRLSFKETLPIGKYRNLNPRKLRADSGGFGSWVSGISFGVSKALDFGSHFFVYRFNANYNFYYSPVHVTGFNAYGGGFETDGTVYPGATVDLQLGLEYTLNQNWVLAFDAQVAWEDTDRFSGHPGRTQKNAGQLLATTPLMANIQYSIAPAIEYNWSANLGLIAGVWFTVAGKNSPKFTSGVIALNYYK